VWSASSVTSSRSPIRLSRRITDMTNEDREM
jgi:hypothetical protein